MAAPRFSFGDFTEEEHDCYLNQPTCVELPYSWNPIASCGYNDSGAKVSNNLEWGAQMPELRDENHNHVPSSKDWARAPSDPVSQCKEGVASHLQGVDPKSSQNTDVQRTSTKTPSQPLKYDTLKNESSTSTDIAQPEEKLKTNGKAFEQKDCKSSGEPMVNGHPEIKGNVVIDNNSGIELSKLNNPQVKTAESTAEDEHSDNNKITERTVEGPSIPNEGFESNAQNGPLSEPMNNAVPVEKVISPVTKTAEKPGSWASLFSGKVQAPKQGLPIPFVEGKSSSVPAPTSNQTKDSSASKKKPVTFNGLPPKPMITTTVVELKDDLFSKQIAEQIRKNEIVYRSPGLMPRGFINSSNWCYINATLQALLTCSPFCHLMRSFPSRQIPSDSHIVTSTPILDSFVRLVKELKPLPKRNIQRSAKEQWYGMPYEPDYIYKMLSTIKSNLSERGRQEDAEEFLSCVLNGLHEEMLKVNEFYNGKLPSAAPHQDDAVVNSSPQTELGYEVPVHEEDPVSDSAQDQEDQWEEVLATRKNRSSVMRRADISKTPVSEVFRGELRSDLHQEGQRGTATLEPFFTLPLDISDNSIWTVNDALDHLTRTESVHDFTNSKTKVKVEATRRQSLETLPPVLVLHLKRFVYDKTGGSQKLFKEIQYHTDLVIGKELLSKSARKIVQEKRSYKLFAVVYHHGKKSTGGHYTTDVYHDGLNCWLRIDDHTIKTTNVHEVVRHNPQRTAYLLYYKRTDLMSV